MNGHTHSQSEDSAKPIRKPSIRKPKYSSGQSLRKADAYLVFVQSREKERTVAESARLAGVSDVTGYAWDKRRIGKLAKVGLEDARSRVASKAELCETLSDLLRDKSVPPPYRVTAGASLAKAMGYEAPRQIEVTDTTPQRPLREMIVLWAAEAAPIKASQLNNEVDITSVIGPATQPSPAKALQAGSAIDAIDVSEQAQPAEPRSPQGGGDEAAPTNSPTATNSGETPHG